MANNYFDQYGRVHHKPVTEADPIPSNNGWIYTAYAQKAGMEVYVETLRKAYNKCKVTEVRDARGFVLIRSPHKDLPPISRDEILGMAALGLLQPSDLNGWNFSPYPIPKFNLITFVKQVTELLDHSEDRNYFWRNYLDQIYRFAFSVPLTDRHFILQKQGKFNLVYWAIAKIDSMFGEDSGIRYLKYGKSKKAMLTEFPADHPIRSL